MTTQASAIDAIQRKVIACRRCPELVAYRETVAREKRRAYRDHDYWGKPVPAFGDPLARVVLVGLAPGAHGSNRTGRMFTGDASGEWLYRALHRAGFANQARQADRNDGMRLRDALITAAVRCAPPGNKPTPGERTACLPYLEAELAAMKGVRVIVTLGKIADDTVHRIVKSYRHVPLAARDRSSTAPRREIALPASPDATVLASYHPSQQNTNTKVLTEAMLDAIFARARELSG